MRRRPRQRVEPNITLAEAFFDLRSDYDAAKSSRYRRKITGVAPDGSGADYHYRNESDLFRMMELARHFDRNDMVIGQAVDRLVNNIVQDGFMVTPATGVDDCDKYLAEKWYNWCDDSDQCDASGDLTFCKICRLALRHTIVDGDVFSLPLGSGDRYGRLQAVEAHRCRTPSNTKRNVVNGVMLNDLRQRLEYWFTRDDIDPGRMISKVSDIKQYPARDAAGNPAVFHIYHPRRFSQTRGITAFARIVNPASLNDDIQFAKMVQQQVVSCFGFIRERGPEYMGGGDQAQRGERSDSTLADGSQRRIEGIAPGMEVAGEIGETFKAFSPQVPNETFFDHAKLILTFIAVNLDLPLAVLMLDPSQTNFSGWRGAIDQARMGWKVLQWDVLVDRLCRPAYKWKVRQWTDPSSPQFDAILAEYIARGANILRHDWKPPSWPYIEPNKDATGDATVIRERLDTRRGVLARRGVDADDVDGITVADNLSFIRRCLVAADAVNGEYPDAGITWRDIAFLSAPKPPGVAEKEGAEQQTQTAAAAAGR